ncbi:AAA family ATPase [Flammeovirga sp. EKP202]|uniref:protein kinase domain-containing protein n=1 Tax=Flammeovirga sp. EKP202 TaxID=2770592 RepID=UPI00165EF120|nr:AAA family ATPase [Flammeovirga sp. EKP202]MBD0404956.1 AAA family ATPase [Flammeovirga sp. EKP202]
MLTSEDLIYTNERYDIIRKEDADTKEVYSLKIIQNETPSESELSQLYNELNLTKDLSINGIREPLKIQKYKDKVALWSRYAPGKTLKKFFPISKPKRFLEIAIKVSKILKDIHGHKIVHKDINPNNILFDIETKKVSIIDFGISSKMETRVEYSNNVDTLEGTLNYIAPEQTGRMNRVIDYRADIYSLGITFFELITNHLPFDVTDSLELIHSHIAREPFLISKFRSDYPKAIEQVISKMIMKDAEDRYNSVNGLIHDLEFILENLNQESLETFEIGKRDYNHQLKIPQKLYGRDSEFNTVLESALKMVDGRKNLLMIDGLSGTGKSFLVNEVHKYITSSNVNFIKGKFDQYQKTVPYFAWIQAFQRYLDNVLTHNQEQLEEWSEKLKIGLGDNAKILTDIIPSLELIIGQQAEVAQLSGIEAQNRLSYLFEVFVSLICNEDNPLIIFIDDLQWADNASLRLLKTISESNLSQYLLIIGAYRTNEVDTSHPYYLTQKEIIQNGVEFENLHLDNLQEKDIKALISDMVEVADYTYDQHNIDAISELIIQKTDGNAFFVNRFIEVIYEKKLLYTEFVGDILVWKWDVEKIRIENITSNVVDLMVEKIKSLPIDVQAVLKPISCLGNSISKSFMEVVFQEDETSLLKTLEPALISGIIYESERDIIFIHDKIQQAVYTTVNEKERVRNHLKCARLLDLQFNENPKSLFDLVNQYNEALSIIDTTYERERIALLNFEAGKIAKQSSAYISSLEYLERAKALLGGDEVWTQNYTIALELFKELADVEYLNRNFEESQAYIENIQSHVHTDLERAEILNMLIIQLTFETDYLKGIETGVKALSILGLTLETENLQEVLGGEVQKMMGKIGNKPIPSLIDEPIMTQQSKIISTQLLVNLIPTAYLSGQMELYAVISAKIINLALEYGHSAESSHGYSNYGGVIAAMMGEYQAAFQFGELALALTHKFDNKYLRCKDSMLFANYINPFTKHVKTSTEINAQGFQLGLESGELQYPGYISMFQVMKPIFMGQSLDEVIKNAEEYISFTNKTKHIWVNDGIRSMKAVAENLANCPNDIFEFDTDHFKEEQHLKECLERNSLNGVAFFLILKAQNAFIYKNYSLAKACLDKVVEVVPAIAGMIITATFNFIQSLVHLIDEPTQESFDLVAQNQLQMKKWMDNCPDNFTHMFLIVEAMKVYAEGKKMKAVKIFKNAIEDAEKNGFSNHAAIAHELLSDLWKELDFEDYHMIHIEKAYNFYNKWGAKTKLALIEQDYPQYKAKHLSLEGESSSSSSTTASIDVKTIIKSVETFSKEVKLDDLLEKMLHTIAENAGARKAVVLLPQNDKWEVSKSYVSSEQETNETGVPMSLVNYVGRKMEILLAKDLSSDDRFNKDIYLKENNVLSVLCIPLVHTNHCNAILYLENNLTKGAFSDRHLELLKMLSTQISISIENSNLYENLEEKVRLRTVELERKNQNITASINYSKRIQQAILPRLMDINRFLPDTTVFFKPKDIVSGDFYWFSHSLEDNRSLIIAADCTGHGVPGALMSMIGDSILKKIVRDQNTYMPDDVLDRMHKEFQKALKTKTTQVKDGMDVAMCMFDHDEEKVYYSGAKNPFVFIKDGELKTVKGSKSAIGQLHSNHEGFELHTFNFSEIDAIYIYSDGYQDQFGGDANRKFYPKRLKQLFLDIHKEKSEVQVSKLEHTLSDWMQKANESQIDDILVIGIKLN